MPLGFKLSGACRHAIAMVAQGIKSIWQYIIVTTFWAYKHINKMLDSCIMPTCFAHWLATGLRVYTLRALWAWFGHGWVCKSAHRSMLVFHAHSITTSMFVGCMHTTTCCAHTPIITSTLNYFHNSPCSSTTSGGGGTCTSHMWHARPIANLVPKSCQQKRYDPHSACTNSLRKGSRLPLL